MNVVIIGAGALGSLFAARLSQTKSHVVLFDYNPKRAQSLQNTLTLQENHQNQANTLTITADSSCLKDADLVLLCTKSADVSQGLELFSHKAPNHAYILGFQNGIHHIHALSQIKHGGFGVTAQGATLLAPGHVRHGGNGPTVIGTLSKKELPLAPFAELLSAAQIPTTVATDIESRLWQKLLINVGINGLTVLHNCPNGRLLHIRSAKEQLIRLVEEGEQVACALGIKNQNNPVQRCLDVCKATASNISSMLQDFRNGKKSEIQAINGALVHEAKKVGIATPENDLIIKRIIEIWPKS